MDLTSLYQQLILDHAKNPIGAGLRDPFDSEVHHVNPTCGDEITLRVRVAGSRLADVSFDAKGCSISVAAASVMADTVTGVDIEEAMREYELFRGIVSLGLPTDADVEELGDAAAFAGVAKFPARVKCALLGWAAMRDAVTRAASTQEG
jgi:nitrogen fixation NifU-like protein